MGRKDWYYVHLPKLLIKRLDSFMETPRAKSMGMTNRPELLRRVINEFLEEQEKLYNRLESIEEVIFQIKEYDHLVIAFNDKEQLQEIVVNFVKRGIDSNNLTVFFITKEEEPEFIDALNRIENINSLFRSEEIMIVNADEYLQDGKYLIDPLMTRLGSIGERAKNRSKSGLSVIGTPPGVLIENGKYNEAHKIEIQFHEAIRKSAMDAMNRQVSNQKMEDAIVEYNTVKVDGLSIFYREIGDHTKPKLVLLHGFPSSSHQYRNLLPALASHFHVVAPDYPGFGNSEFPSPDDFNYTFERLAEVVEDFLKAIDFKHFGLYMQDYGGPVGFRIITRHPEWLEWLILQNTNAYEIGFTNAWDGLRNALWKGRTPQTESPLYGLLKLDTIRQIYIHGHKDPTLISPDNWNMDFSFLGRPNVQRLHMDLFYDYRKNVELYPKWQKFLRDNQPETLIYWGQNDIFFTREGGEAYLEDLSNAEMHRLDSGHFALEDCLNEISAGIIRFYLEKIVRKGQDKV